MRLLKVKHKSKPKVVRKCKNVDELVNYKSQFSFAPSIAGGLSYPQLMQIYFMDDLYCMN